MIQRWTESVNDVNGLELVFAVDKNTSFGYTCIDWPLATDFFLLLSILKFCFFWFSARFCCLLSDFWCQIFHFIQLTRASTFDCNRFSKSHYQYPKHSIDPIDSTPQKLLSAPSFGCKSWKNCFWNHFLIVSESKLANFWLHHHQQIYILSEARAATHSHAFYACKIHML